MYAREEKDAKQATLAIKRNKTGKTRNLKSRKRKI